MQQLFYFWDIPYFRWHLIFTVVPSIILWLLYWKTLFRYKKTILTITILGFLGGFLMDTVASTWLHVWHFNYTKNTGISFLGLPIGEYFFFIFVPQEITGIFLLVRRKMLYGKI